MSRLGEDPTDDAPSDDAPWIGVTTYHREREGRTRFSLPDAYVEGVRRAGGRPLLLPPGEPDPVGVLARLDGLVLTGGGDLHPEILGEPVHGTMYSFCEERDRFELELIRAALDRETPVLAICRGMQILNVALGGDLHLHLPDAVGEDVVHRRTQDDAAAHPVRLAPDSDLAALFAGASLDSVASWHHQGVRRLGEGLVPVAWAEDDVIEALELPGAADLRAIQWHPELDLAEDAAGLRLFRDLVGRARR